MLTFYLIAGGLAVLAAATLVRPLVAGRSQALGRDARDAQVFRDQLAEIDRDLARGTITPQEADGARIEVSRRLLAADQRAGRAGAPQPAPRGHSGLVAGLALIGTPALAAALYFGLGAPGVPDQPLASRLEAIAASGALGPRPAQAEAEAAMAGREPAREEPDPQYAGMVRQLEAVLEDRPSDVRGHTLLANSLMSLGRYAEAWRTYDKVIELSDGTAGADIHAAKAEGMIMAAGGYISPEAEEELARALELDPSLPIARYYEGLALAQAGRLDDAVATWEELREDSPADAPYLDWLDTMLADARQQRGRTPKPDGAAQAAGNDDRPIPPGGGQAAGSATGQASPGPTQADIAAAARMSPEERAAAIDSMVARLETRLTDQGGSAEEWLRLIQSYVKLDRREDAERAYRLAAKALQGQPEAGFVREQALLMGVRVE